MAGPRTIYGIAPPTGRYVREDRCQAPVDRLKTLALRPPIDLLYAAGAFEAAGCAVTLDDYPVQDFGWDRLERRLREAPPDLLLLSVTTQTLPADVKAAALAKAIAPHTRTIAKGAHFNTLDIDALDRYPMLDVVLRGEIEETCLDLGRGLPLSDIPGLTWRGDDGRAIRNPDRAFTGNLDDLPFPARHLIDNRHYTRPDTGAPQTSIVTNRGCPFHCVYCLANQTAGTRNRYRSVDNVLAEMRECIERHGIRDFLFRADLFTQNRAWVIELCRAIIEHGLDIAWSCNARVDSVDLEMLQWMRRAGCWLIAFGVESGDQTTLDRLEKRAQVADAKRAVGLCREAGIKSSVYLLMGLPWDTRDSAVALGRYLRKLNPDIAEIFFAYPFPGTPLHATCVELGLLAPGEIPTHSYDAPAFRGLHLSIDEMAALRRAALRGFYLRPSKIVGTLRGARSPLELRNYVRVGLAQLRQLMATG